MRTGEGDRRGKIFDTEGIDVADGEGGRVFKTSKFKRIRKQPLSSLR